MNGNLIDLGDPEPSAPPPPTTQVNTNTTNPYTPLTSYPPPISYSQPPTSYPQEVSNTPLSSLYPPLPPPENQMKQPIGPNDLLYQKQVPTKTPKLIELNIIFQSNWHPNIPPGYFVKINCYTTSTWRYIRNIYANTIQIPECSIFLSNNGIAFDADMTLNEYSIDNNYQLEAYLVPGIKFK